MVLLSFLRDRPRLFSRFPPCFFACTAPLLCCIRKFVFLAGFQHLRKWFSCAHCSRCPLAAGYDRAGCGNHPPPLCISPQLECAAPCLSVPPGGVYSPLNRAAYTLHCHYVMTLCPLLAAGCFVIMSGTVCAVLFSGCVPCLFACDILLP